MLVAVKNRAVDDREQIGRETLADCGSDFLGAGPDVAEIHRHTLRIQADGFVRQIDEDRTGQGIGHHQRRRTKVIGPNLWMDTGFEVTVAAQHSGHDQVLLVDGSGNGVTQRPAVADAGGAAIANHIKAEGFKVRQEAALLKIPGNHPGTGGQTGLDPRLAGQPARPRLTGKESCADHHIRVGGVGATGDGGDDHRSICQLGT